MWAAAMASSTLGSGGNGLSFDDSLNASAGAGRPWRYGASAAISGRSVTGMRASLGARDPKGSRSAPCHPGAALGRDHCHNGPMGRLLLRLLINAVALWLTTVILNPHVTIQP